MPQVLKNNGSRFDYSSKKRFVSSVDAEGKSNLMDFFKKGNNMKFYNQRRVETPIDR